MDTSLKAAVYAVLISCVLVTRLWFVLPGLSSRNRPPKKSGSTVRLAVFLGSGGHTSEALNLISALDFEQYSPRIYVASEGDALSVKKAQVLETLKAPNNAQYTILTVPRARKVHQSLLTAPFTALLSFFKCAYYVTLLPISKSTPGSKGFADVLIVNGPGTCFILCLAVLVNKILGLPAPRIIYIESFARVKSLSISGKLLRYIADSGLRSSEMGNGENAMKLDVILQAIDASPALRL
ncbi:UDP-N-acetylglucosamine transferase subunit [Marasmius crinis-equi]|uniref:UDP-N-acetylglucosamine transferase subunit ALG14 n=1 Tax=Marasmius crinis-equi TaxID=585013 RepID=A0ABR3FQ23_9AGAR